MNVYFVTGTSTEVGKTWISQALLHAARVKGLRTIALKPVAAGCEAGPGGLRNDDALALQSAATEQLPYEMVNPVALTLPIAPHIAAEEAGVRLSVSDLAGRCRQALARPHDFALVEGAGGWRVPLNKGETLADLAIALGSPVILVVGMGLGCLNHAFLTAEAIRSDGLPVAGWVANSPGLAMPHLQQNIIALKERLGAPCLGVVPFTQEGPAAAANYLDLRSLLPAV